MRQNPKLTAEKILKEKENIKIKEDGTNAKKITYKEKFIISSGDDLFDTLAENIKSKSECVALQHSDKLIMIPEEEIALPDQTTEDIDKNHKLIKEKIDKIRYKLLREKNKKEGLFKEHFIFPFLSGKSVEDALVAQLLSAFHDKKQSCKSLIDVIYNCDVNFIGVNLRKKKNKFEGFLIFAY
jgi:hypothetical protein